MKIENFTCELCGKTVPSLAETEEITLRCTAENYDETIKYCTCEACASTFKGMDIHKIATMLLHSVGLEYNIIEE